MFTDFTVTEPADPTDPGACASAPAPRRPLTRMLEEIVT